MAAPGDGPRARPPIFGVEGRDCAGAFVVDVRGELDVATLPQFEAVVRAGEHSGHRRMVVDLGAVTFVDSGGVNALLQLHRRMTSASLELLILPGRPRVQRVFVLMGLTTTLPFLA
ncbi:MAG: anti-sigma-factor antagonist [Solirubrobacterales bacterium]|nr:anti-sigma-factor antagonist [Solirubrobacterales bacterium]